MPAMQMGTHVRRREDRQPHPVIGTVIAVHGNAVVTVEWELPHRPGQARRTACGLYPRTALIVLEPPPETAPGNEARP